jgi:beta-lactamase regulating signal transducer with metallopeptidase domain
MTRPFTDVAGELAFAQLWQVTLVIAVAALVTRLACARRAHLAHLVWLVVLIKCLTPPLWSSPTGVFSWAMHGAADNAQSAAAIATAGARALDESVASPADQGSEMTKLAAAANRPTASKSSTALPAAATKQDPIEAPGTSRHVVRLLLLGWAAGAAAYAGFALFVAAVSWRAVRRSRCPDDESATALLEILARRLDVRRTTRLLLVNEPLGPMTFGWIRPAIIVPQPLIDGRPAAEIEPLLAHELIHVRRGDVLVGMLQLAAQCVWWFHPLVWWANREMGRERERCCDEEVVAGLACPPAAYARSLVNVLELKRQLRWLGPLPGLRPFEVTKQRLERLMTHSADFRARMPRGYWLLLLAGVLLLAPGARLATRVDESTANAAKSDAAAALVQRVYDNFAWVERVRSFHIRTAYTTQPTAEGLRWDQEHPLAISGGVPHFDPRPYHIDFEWAWDQTRIRYAYQNHYEGDAAFGLQTRTWDGSLGVEVDKTSDQTDKSYVLDNRFDRGFFTDRQVTQQLELPWGPGGPYHFWWLPTDVAHYRQGMALAPEDFVLLADETVNGRPCHVLKSRIAGSRLDVGVTDGRLYRRTLFNSSRTDRETDLSPVFQKIAGPEVKTYNDLTNWLKSLGPEEQARASHQLVAAFAERSPRDRIAWRQDFDDYREVAPGCWLPFRQSLDTFSYIAPQPFLETHADQHVTEVAINQPLPADLFHIELKEGTEVTTDWRYDPPIRYTYRKDQTEAERLSLRDAEQKSRATHFGQKFLADAQSGGKANENSAPTRKTVAPESRKNSRLPRLIESVPKAGQSDVSADLKEIRVTFDRDMGKGMSWTGSPDSFFPPGDESQKAHWIDSRTCVLPVKLEKGKFYRVGINADSYRNFRSARGVSFPSSVIFFATEGASAEVRDRLRVPKIVELKPANSANEVDPSITELRVTFDVPMGKGMSWTGGGPSYPAGPSGARAEWSSDGKTCILPVTLRPGHSYRLGLNSLSYNNFQSESGVPLEPVVYQFKTR